jgi:D-serine deaminase-like pyridoxal phosphate-dependent protein
MVNLARHGADILFAVGHKRQVELLEASASRGQQVRLDVLLDLDVSDHRAGIEPGEPALELAKSIVGSNHLKLHGIQAYSGRASHTVGSENRIATSREAMGKALATRDLLAKHGLATTILSGGSTGTYNIDSLIPGVTELQVGSYVFMDLDYRRIGSVGGQEHYLDFQFSLRVLTTVVNVHSDRAIVDAGTKAFATDVPYVPEVLADRGWVYKRMGDEFGMITAEPGVTLPKLGDRIEFIVPHCDPTANLYDRFYALRGDRVEAEWRTTARKLCNSDVSG